MQFSLYANLHSQTCGILRVMTFEFARVSDFSPHVVFAIKWHSICDLGFATFRSESFRSGDISVRLWNHAEILHVHILMQTYFKSTRSFTLKNGKHDPRSNS